MHVAVDDGLAARRSRVAVGAAPTRRASSAARCTRSSATTPAESLAAFAEREKATQLVLGASRRSRWHELVHGSFVARVTRLAGDVDVHVIAQRLERQLTTRRSSTRRAAPALDRRRVIGAWLLAVGRAPVAHRGHACRSASSIALSTELLVCLVVGAGHRRDRWTRSSPRSLQSSHHCWSTGTSSCRTTRSRSPRARTSSPSSSSSASPSPSARWSTSPRSARCEARRARLEAEALARSTTSLAADPEPLPASARSAARDVRPRRRADRRAPRSTAWSTVASAGDVGWRTDALRYRCTSSLTGGTGSDRRCSVFGRTLSIDDQRLLRVLADQLAVAVDNRRLVAEAAEAAALAEIDAVRTALLRAVSHDLRTPLASIKAMISGLRDPDGELDRRAARRGARDRRSGDRSAQPARRQPARRQPTADRCPRCRHASDSAVRHG